MTNFSFKQINSMLVDSSGYNNLFTHVIDIPRKIMFLEKHFLPMFFKNEYKRGIYLIGNKKPILPNYTKYVNKHKEEIIVNSLDDLETVFNTEDTIFVDSDVYCKALTKQDYMRNRLVLSEYCTYPLFTEDFLNMVVSRYMRTTNSESDLVDTDLFGYSEHIKLLDDDYKDMDIVDFFRMYGISDSVQYKELLLTYELLYMDVLSICSKFNPLSVKVEINNNLIKLMFYDSPSSRRYNINKVVSATDDISMYREF